jgi:G:T/U-mismatch repair DNA glycosylase
MQKSIHPYDPYVPENATKLVIGSIPPPRFCLPNPKLKNGDVDFYYGSGRNCFWKILGFDLSAPGNGVERRKIFLKDMNVGITDIVGSCVRKKENSAMDQDLADLELKDIKTLLAQHRKIDTLIYTSEFVKGLLEKATGLKHISLDFSKRPRKFAITIEGRKYIAYVLYSPSPLALRGLGKNGSVVRKRQYNEIFGMQVLSRQDFAN